MAIEKEVIINANTAAAEKNVQNLNKEIKNTEKSAGNAKKSFAGVGSFIDKMSGGLISKFQGVTKSVGGLTKGFGLLRGAVIATGLGGLVVIIGSLVEWFTNFEAGVKVVTQIMNTLAGTVNAIVENFSKLLKGDFLGFFKGVAKGAQDAWENTNKLYEAEQKLFELQRDLTVQNAKLNAEIESYARQTRDTTLSLEERLEAQDNLNKSAEQLIENERALAQAELDRLEIELALENNYKKRRDLELQIQQTMAGLINAESRLQAQLDKGARAKRQILEDDKRQEDERLEKAKEISRKIIQEREAERLALLGIEINFQRQIEDLEDETEKQRLARAKARALQQVEEMKGTEEDKEKARLQILEFYGKKEEELKEKTIKVIEAAEDEYLNRFTSKQGLEELAVKEKYRRLIKLAKEYGEDVTLLEQARDVELAEIEIKANERKEKIQKEFDLRRRELEAKTEAEREAIELEKLEIERAKKEAELIQLGIDSESRLEILEFYSKQEDAIRQKYAEQEEARQEALRDQTIALAAGTFGQIANILGQNSKAGKAFAIAESLINTYQGITAALKLPFPANIPGVAYASATGFAAVKNIASTNVSNPSASGSFSSPAPASAPVQAPEFNVLGQGGFNQLAETLGQQQQQPIQTYVVANDVTTMQSLDRNIVQNATL